jgi:P27 family predicted phage terminase small subunit
MQMTAETVPAHLSEASKALWQQINAAWELDVSHLVLLQTALECYDIMTECREKIAAEGIVYLHDNGATCKHPALQVWKDSRSHFLQAWKQLGFDLEPPQEVGRPPGT